MTSEYETRPSATDIAVGDEGPEVVVEEIEREDFVRYAGASGDFNPIHYDEPYATAAGNESVFGQGMLIAGYASHMLTDWVGLDAITRFRTRFTARVWPGDSVAVTGTVTGKTETDDGAEIEIEFEATNGDGETVLSGDATAELPARRD